MNPEVKQKWITALRSGEYQQTTHRLKVEHESECAFCCLGVLCDLYLKDYPAGLNVEKVFGPNDGKEYSYDKSLVALPDKVMSWAGLGSYMGASVTIDGHLSTLASHNDRGVTFDQIAQAIEENL